MAQAVSSRPVTAEARVQPFSVHVGYVVDKVAVGQVSVQVLQFSPVTIISTLFSILVFHLGVVVVIGRISVI
jgi:hypothetical protein